MESIYIFCSCPSLTITVARFVCIHSSHPHQLPCSLPILPSNPFRTASYAPFLTQVAPKILIPLFSSPFPQIIFFSAFPSSHSLCFPAAPCMLSSLQPLFSPSPPTMLSSSDLYLTSLPQTYLHMLDSSLNTILTYCIHSFQIILA